MTDESTAEATLAQQDPGVVEHVQIRVMPGTQGRFETAFRRGHAAVSAAPGYRWARLAQQVEEPTQYLLLIGWDTLEAHTVGFRSSELFVQWRAAIGEYLAEPPVVAHYWARPAGGGGGPGSRARFVAGWLDARSDG